MEANTCILLYNHTEKFWFKNKIYFCVNLQNFGFCNLIFNLCSTFSKWKMISGFTGRSYLPLNLPVSLNLNSHCILLIWKSIPTINVFSTILDPGSTRATADLLSSSSSSSLPSSRSLSAFASAKHSLLFVS